MLRGARAPSSATAAATRAPPPPRRARPSDHPSSLLVASLAAAALAWGGVGAAAPAWAAQTPPNSPLIEAKQGVLFGPTPDGSIRPCQGNIQPNCVSTASTNDLYAPPWRAGGLTVAEAARVLEREALALPGARLVRSIDNVAGTGAAYRAWRVDGVFGPDIFETVVKPERGGGVERGSAAAEADTEAAAPEGRGEGGGGGGGDGGSAAPRAASSSSPSSRPSALVTYRSSATQAKYIFPFQTALTDGGAQRKRAAALRAASNFSLVGCSSNIECFIE